MLQNHIFCNFWRIMWRRRLE